MYFVDKYFNILFDEVLICPAELDFVIQIENQIIPIEAKSWESVRSQSLETFRKKYSIKKSIRISAKNFGFENGIKSVPLYAVWCIK